jgi:hypothetical protein
MKSTFETIYIWLFFHRPVGLVELLILYACVQFYPHQALDYRLSSKTAYFHDIYLTFNTVIILNELTGNVPIYLL